MKKIVVVLVSFVVAILVIVGYVFTHKASTPHPWLSCKWKLVNRDPNGFTTYINTGEITHLPGGLVKVWTLDVPNGQMRKILINGFKRGTLYFGGSPSDAEKFENFWYDIYLYKFNCKTHQFAILYSAFYSFEKTILSHYSYHHEEWKDIPPRTIFKVIENYVCK